VAEATQKWSGTSLCSLREHCLLCHERFRVDRSQLQRSLVCSYEDFASEPQRCLDSIYRFLGLPRHESSLQVSARESDRYLGRWQQYLSSEDAAERADALELVRRFGARVREFGYSLAM